MKKVKNRHRVLLFCEDQLVTNDVLMLLSSHGYLVDTADNYEEVCAKLLNYKHSILIADVDQLPEDPNTVFNLFRKARKSPVFLLINRLNSVEKIRAYLDAGVDDLLSMPIDADKLYRKVKRAAEYNRMQHEIEYHSGMVFILKMLIPVLMTIVFIITNRG